MIVDTNVYLSRWPFRRLPDDEPEALVARLRHNLVGQAWAGSFDGVLHKDISAVNARLAEDCRRFGAGLLLPFGSVNPKLTDWQEDLRRCHEVHRMPGIRLHPNYHGYTLDDPLFGELLRMASARKLVVQVVVQMEDDRMQHPLMKIPAVDVAPLPGLVERDPSLRLMLLNAVRSVSAPVLKTLGPAAGIRLDIAMLDGVGGVGRLVERISATRVLFGSHAPFYIHESAVLKLAEAALPEAVGAQVAEKNARAMLNFAR